MALSNLRAGYRAELRKAQGLPALFKKVKGESTADKATPFPGKADPSLRAALIAALCNATPAATLKVLEMADPSKFKVNDVGAL